MLFPTPDHVDATWAIISRATAKGQLGIAAKVAPRAVFAPTKAHLICVYTKDFSDIADVRRVLRRMKELELVKAEGRPIYYKAGEDAF